MAMRAGSSDRPDKRPETRNIDAFGEPQPHQQELVGHFLARQRVVGDEAVAGGLDAHEPGLRPFFRRCRVPVALDIESPVGARPDAGIFLGAPIDEVVPAFAAGPRVVGNLVGRQAVRGANLQGGVVQLAAEIVVGNDELARGMERGKRRVLLDGQLIEREVVAGFGQRAGEFARPILRVLARPGIDQIERVAIENAARDADRIERFARGVHAAKLGQHAIVERLDAKRDAVDAGATITAEAGGFDAGRIGFEADLDVGRDAPVFCDRVEDRRQRGRLHQRRRAAAEEDRRNGSVRHPRRGRRDLGGKGAHEARLVDRLAAHMAVEVAIGTFRQAERPVNVDAEGGLFAVGQIVSGRTLLNQGTPPRAS